MGGKGRAMDKSPETQLIGLIVDRTELIRRNGSAAVIAKLGQDIKEMRKLFAHLSNRNVQELVDAEQARRSAEESSRSAKAEQKRIEELAVMAKMQQGGKAPGPLAEWLATVVALVASILIAIMVGQHAKTWFDAGPAEVKIDYDIGKIIESLLVGTAAMIASVAYAFSRKG